MRSVSVEDFSPKLTLEVEEVADHFNGNHADTVLLIARFAGGSYDATAAEIAKISPRGLTLAVEGVTANDVLLAFESEVNSLEVLQASVMGLIVRSRQAAGNTVELTSIEREVANTKALQTFITQVVRTRSVTPNLREITLQGGLDAFRSIAGDQFVYLMVDKSGQTDVIHEGVTMAGLRALPLDERPASAYYTVRAFRSEVGELDLWFVQHDHQGGVSGWASRAQSGDRVALWGPRTAFEPPEGTRELLLVGDETAFAAIAGILEACALPARVVVETVDQAHVVSFSPRSNVMVDWIFRGQTSPHESTNLYEVVKRVLPEWRAGLYVYGAAESSRARLVRGYCRGLGGRSEQVHMTAYWRHGRALNG
ncbi:MAG: siderophore-interacting protein [Myxococcota bacterium]